MFNFLETSIGKYIPNDSLGGCSIKELIRRHLINGRDLKILDLGCGDGNLADFIQGYSWTYVGCDVANSPEGQRRTKQDVPFVIYAGESLPFLDTTFDCVLLNHVLEHIEKPYVVFKEISRILKEGGILMGSVSQLEPYHSYSLWNITPYGLWCFTKATPLVIKELRPGVDFLSLTIGIVLFRFKKVVDINKETLVNKVIHLLGKVLGKTVARINAAKLFLAGHYLFVIKKESGDSK